MTVTTLSPTDPPWIFVISDATGSTAEMVVRAALLQFGERPARLRIFPQVRTHGQLDDLLSVAAEVRPLLVYTLVHPGLRDALHLRSEELGLPTVDLFSLLLVRLSNFLNRPPSAQPGLHLRMDEDYFRRIEAVEFAVQNDDGQRLHNIDKADIVLVGVSRTSKTPVSAVLASRGYKVANIPLVPGIPPPPAIFELPPGKVFALTIDPLKLLEIRRSRLAAMGVEGSGDYANRRQVIEEVRWALQLYRQQTSWPILDVTHQAIEETAAEVLRWKFTLEQRAPDPDP